MAIRQKITPNMPKVAENENLRQNVVNWQDGIEAAHRNNLGMPKDGTEPFEAPLPLQQVATADRPPAADNEGAYIYDTDINRTIFSDGTAWIVQPSPAESAEAAQDAVGAILTDTATIDFTYNDAAPSITADVKNNSIDNTKLADMATARIKARVTAATGDPEDATLSQVLDLVGSAANGDILTRAAGVWARLGIGGTDDQLKVTAGLPVWFTPTAPAVVALTPVTVTNGTTNVDFALDNTYSMVEFDIINAAPVTDSNTINIRLSQSGSFLSGASDYMYGAQGGVAAASSNAASVISFGIAVGNSTDEDGTYTLRIFRPGVTSFRKNLIWYGGARDGTPTAYGANGWGKLAANSNAIDGIRFFWQTGNWTGGYILWRGYR